MTVLLVRSVEETLFCSAQHVFDPRFISILLFLCSQTLSLLCVVTLATFLPFNSPHALHSNYKRLCYLWTDVSNHKKRERERENSMMMHLSERLSIVGPS